MGKTEHSAMSIVFYKDTVLVLTNKRGLKVFPKGHIEEGEESLAAAIRECHEEAGIDIKEATYLGAGKNYVQCYRASDFGISQADFKILCNSDILEKMIDVHVFRLETVQPICPNQEERFIEGQWMPLSLAAEQISHPGSKEALADAVQRLLES